MIRRSTAIATAAILLSLFIHVLGLNLSSPLPTESSPGVATTEVVALGNAFEDIAEPPSDPVTPESARAPEPPVETPPQPDFADIPATEALVASANPQPAIAPGTNTAKIEQPETIEPSEPEQSAAPLPETSEPSGSGDGAVADIAETSPIDTADAAKPALSPPVAQAPKLNAALPVPITAVTPTADASAVPVIPLELETIEPETSEAVELAPEDPELTEAEKDLDRSDLAVISSLRPQLPSRRSFIESEESPEGASDGPTPPSRIIESPLTAYQRDGTDLTIPRNNGTGILDSRTPGNSDVTNYAGRVLMQLNRTPTVRISAKGFARVHFEINSDGTLARVDIIDGTGSLEINNAAKAQVRNSAPFPRPPNGANRKLTFVYRID